MGAKHNACLTQCKDVCHGDEQPCVAGSKTRLFIVHENITLNIICTNELNKHAAHSRTTSAYFCNYQQILIRVKHDTSSPPFKDVCHGDEQPCVAGSKTRLFIRQENITLNI